MFITSFFFLYQSDGHVPFYITLKPHLLECVQLPLSFLNWQPVEHMCCVDQSGGAGAFCPMFSPLFLLFAEALVMPRQCSSLGSRSHNCRLVCDYRVHSVARQAVF